MAKYEYDGQGVSPADFSVFPAGDYHLVISKYTEKTNKHGLPSYRIECLVDAPGTDIHGKKCWNNINLLPKENNGAGIAIHFLKSIGEPWEGKFSVDADNWIGKRFFARVIIDKNSLNGREENQITGVKAAQDGKTFDLLTKERWQRAAQEAEEIPF